VELCEYLRNKKYGYKPLCGDRNCEIVSLPMLLVMKKGGALLLRAGFGLGSPVACCTKGDACYGLELSWGLSQAQACSILPKTQLPLLVMKRGPQLLIRAD
jgi:hypothetical protein